MPKNTPAPAPKDSGLTLEINSATIIGGLGTVVGFILLTLWSFNAQISKLENRTESLQKIEAKIESSKVELNAQIAEVEEALDKVAKMLFEVKLDMARKQIGAAPPYVVDPKGKPILGPLTPMQLPDRVKVPKDARSWRLQHQQPEKSAKK